MKRFRRICLALLLISAFCLTFTACGSKPNFRSFKKHLLNKNFRLSVTQNGNTSEIEVDGDVSYYPNGLSMGDDSLLYYIEDLGDGICQYYKTGETWTVEEVGSANRIPGMSEAIANKDNYEKDGDVYRMPDGIIEGFTDCTLQFKETSVVFSFVYQKTSAVTFEFSDLGNIELTLPKI